MNELITFFVLLFFSLCGYSFLYGFRMLPRAHFFEKLPYAFGLGVGFGAYQLFIYSQLSVPWNIFTISLPWMIIIVFTLYKRFDIVRKDISFRFSTSFVDRMMIAIITLLLIFVAFEAWLRPLYAWDGWAIWLLKGKMFYIDGFVNPLAYNILKEGYPFVINLSVSLIYIVLGQADDRAVLLLFYFFYLSLGIAFFFAIKHQLGTTKALFFTFLLLSMQNMIRHGGRYEAGYADLSLGFYFFSSTMLLLNYIRTKNYKTLLLLGIFMGITRLIKDEGLIYSVFLHVILLFYIISKFRNMKHVFISFIWLIPVLDWQLFKFQNNMYYSLYEKIFFHPQRFLPVLSEVSREFLSVKNWNLLWVSFFIGCVVSAVYKKKDSMLFYILIFSQLLAYVFIFMISPYEPAIHVRNVIDRLFLHLAPLALYTVAITYYEVQRGRKKRTLSLRGL